MTLSAQQPQKSPRAVLFDLDGTLLQVEMNSFIPAYVGGLAAHFSDLAPRSRFVDTVISATFALLRDDGDQCTNQQLFLGALQRHLGIAPEEFGRRFENYLDDGLHGLAPLIEPLGLARDILALCFERDWTVVIATNPVFPRQLVEARLRWGGLDEFPYHLVTSYENTRFCKPHPGYFTDILDGFGLAPEECLMVGNDTEHDLAAGLVGIPTWLVDTWLIDRLGGAYQSDYRGDHQNLLTFLQQV
ncbi:HAD family hydrolase [Geoalkalibacter halelectricus]|uniref:HAD family hydrolase n=1 Tax=Geoalkalibacter halelectricus TaxID=2847045 RepID=UPI00266EE691|nr:HAD family hydrolase [Geoalkalibacter halelectricus]MDO3377616.1 HAD family hydrolase [Geoalkalibacter halelectricus]